MDGFSSAVLAYIVSVLGILSTCNIDKTTIESRSQIYLEFFWLGVLLPFCIFIVFVLDGQF